MQPCCIPTKPTTSKMGYTAALVLLLAPLIQSSPLYPRQFQGTGIISGTGGASTGVPSLSSTAPFQNTTLPGVSSTFTPGLSSTPCGTGGCVTTTPTTTEVVISISSTPTESPTEDATTSEPTTESLSSADTTSEATVEPTLETTQETTQETTAESTAETTVETTAETTAETTESSVEPTPEPTTSADSATSDSPGDVTTDDPATVFPTFVAPTTTISAPEETSAAIDIGPVLLWLFDNRNLIEIEDRKQEYIDNVEETFNDITGLFTNLPNKPEVPSECSGLVAKRSLISGILDLLDDAAKLITCATQVVTNLVEQVKIVPPPINVVTSLTDNLKDLTDKLKELEQDQPDDPTQSEDQPTETEEPTSTATSSCTQTEVPKCTETVSLSTSFDAQGSSTVETVTSTECVTITACDAEATTETTTASTTTSAAGVVCEVGSCTGDSCNLPAPERRRGLPADVLAEPTPVPQWHGFQKRTLPEPISELQQTYQKREYIADRLDVLSKDKKNELDWAFGSIDIVSNKMVFGEEQQARYVAGIVGCSSIVIASKKGMWFSHLMEPAFMPVEERVDGPERLAKMVNLLKDGGDARMEPPANLAVKDGILEVDGENSNQVHLYVMTPRKPGEEADMYQGSLEEVLNVLIGEGAPFSGLPLEKHWYDKPKDEAEKDRVLAPGYRGRALLEYDSNEGVLDEETFDIVEQDPRQAVYRVWLEDRLFEVQWDYKTEEASEVVCDYNTCGTSSGQCNLPAEVRRRAPELDGFSNNSNNKTVERLRSFKKRTLEPSDDPDIPLIPKTYILEQMSTAGVAGALDYAFIANDVVSKTIVFDDLEPEDEKGKEAQALKYINGLTGCTAIVIASKKGIWYSHFMEPVLWLDRGNGRELLERAIGDLTNGVDKPRIGNAGDGPLLTNPNTLAEPGGILDPGNNNANKVQMYIMTPRAADKEEARYTEALGRILNVLTGEGAAFGGVPVEEHLYNKPQMVKNEETGEQEVEELLSPFGKVLIEYDNNQFDKNYEPQDPRQAVYRVWMEDKMFEEQWNYFGDCSQPGTESGGTGNQRRQEACTLSPTASTAVSSTEPATTTPTDISVSTTEAPATTSTDEPTFDSTVWSTVFFTVTLDPNNPVTSSSVIPIISSSPSSETPTPSSTESQAPIATPDTTLYDQECHSEGVPFEGDPAVVRSAAEEWCASLDQSGFGQMPGSDPVTYSYFDIGSLRDLEYKVTWHSACFLEEGRTVSQPIEDKSCADLLAESLTECKDNEGRGGARRAGCLWYEFYATVPAIS